MDEDDYIEIKYEALCIETNKVIAKIMQFVGLTPQSSIDYTKWIKQRNSPLLKVLQKKQETVLSRIEPYLSYCMYTTENNA